MCAANRRVSGVFRSAAFAAFFGGVMVLSTFGADDQPPPDNTDDPSEVVLARGRAGKRVIGPKPITIELCASDETRELLWWVARPGAGSLRLTVAGVQYTDAPVEVRVFFNHPKATIRTSDKDPHYLGSFAFFGSDDSKQGQSFAFDLGQTFRVLVKEKELEANDRLSVTLFVAPVREDESIDGVSIRFDRVEISTAKPEP